MTPNDYEAELNQFIELKELLVTGDIETATAWVDAVIKMYERTPSRELGSVVDYSDIVF